MGVLAEPADHVIGVDTHRDADSAAVVAVGTAAVAAQTTIAADAFGYRRLLRFAPPSRPSPARVGDAMHRRGVVVPEDAGCTRRCPRSGSPVSIAARMRGVGAEHLRPGEIVKPLKQASLGRLDVVPPGLHLLERCLLVGKRRSVQRIDAAT
jgi:hypothetical protein